MNFFLLETGGTINGILGPDEATPAHSFVAGWLGDRSATMDFKYSTQIVCMKDSRAISDDDRSRLTAAIINTPADRILIPHGTYTMPATGMYLREHLDAAAQTKCVVLVGSLVPLLAPETDADASLEFALQVLREKPAGVWIAMQGELMHPGEVEKDLESGRYIRRR